jgi:hypothetical protein
MKIPDLIYCLLLVLQENAITKSAFVKYTLPCIARDPYPKHDTYLTHNPSGSFLFYGLYEISKCEVGASYSGMKFVPDFGSR